MSHDRSRIACMMRIRNEARWIRKSLEQTFKVAQTIVILDDGSDDDTRVECVDAVGGQIDSYENGAVSLITGKQLVAGEENILHYIKSPFRPAVRPTQAVSEIRDKNFLWEYCKSRVNFTHMLCLDGDEVLSKEFVQDFGELYEALEAEVDIVTVPFLYLWDTSNTIRIDGIYGNLPDGHPRLRFPRVFSIKRVSEDHLHIMRFSWEGSKGGFHCGSVPRENFRPRGSTEQVSAEFFPPIIHYGYRDEADRRRKFTFYNKIDPGNKFEGEYLHIIGEPNIHAPGPVVLKPWSE
jgi:glycosyltransferase involved in cell wall biosynthesis